MKTAEPWPRNKRSRMAAGISFTAPHSTRLNPASEQMDFNRKEKASASDPKRIEARRRIIAGICCSTAHRMELHRLHFKTLWISRTRGRVCRRNLRAIQELGSSLPLYCVRPDEWDASAKYLSLSRQYHILQPRRSSNNSYTEMNIPCSDFKVHVLPA